MSYFPSINITTYPPIIIKVLPVKVLCYNAWFEIWNTNAAEETNRTVGIILRSINMSNN